MHRPTTEKKKKTYSQAGFVSEVTSNLRKQDVARTHQVSQVCSETESEKPSGAHMLYGDQLRDMNKLLIW